LPREIKEMPSVTENNGKYSGMDEAHLLMPWHVTGKLEDAEARELEALAKEDPEFAKLIAEAKQEAEAVTSVNEALGGPSLEVWARIEKSAGEERRVHPHAVLAERIHALRASVSEFFAGLTAPQWQAVAAAAVAVCVIQAAAIVYLAGGKPSADYRTASGPQTQTSARHSAFIVSFAEGASIGEIGKALDDAGAEIMGGPDSDMVYHLALRSDTVQSRERAYAKLQSSGVVKMILPEK